MSEPRRNHHPRPGRKASGMPTREHSPRQPGPLPAREGRRHFPARKDPRTPDEDWKLEEHWAFVTAHTAQMYFPAEG